MCSIFFPFHWSSFLSFFPSLTGQQSRGTSSGRMDPPGARIFIQSTLNNWSTWRANLLEFRARIELPHVYKQTEAHAHALLHEVHTQTLASVARLVAVHLCGRLSEAIILLYGPAPSLTTATQSAEAQNNSPTGTLHCVIATSAKCPSPGYSFTPLYPT